MSGEWKQSKDLDPKIHSSFYSSPRTQEAQFGNQEMSVNLSFCQWGFRLGWRSGVSQSGSALEYQEPMESAPHRCWPKVPIGALRLFTNSLGSLLDIISLEKVITTLTIMTCALRTFLWRTLCWQQMRQTGQVLPFPRDCFLGCALPSW